MGNTVFLGAKRALALVLATAALVTMSAASAQSKEVEVGLIAPMSGPWARQGQVMKLAADMAIETINQQGGIKALGGAKLKLSVFDAGDTVEKAKNAAQRMVADAPNLVVATGAYLSSFTLAVTEVTERAQLPVVTFSYSDLITSRGFKYVFQTSATGVQQAEGSLPALMEMAEKASGKRPQTIGIVMDNTAASVSFVKPMRDHQFAKLGLKLVVDETFTPPLANATPLIQKVRSARPDILILLPTVISDAKLLLEKMNEFGLGRGKLRCDPRPGPAQQHEHRATGRRHGSGCQLDDQRAEGFRRGSEGQDQRAVADPAFRDDLWRHTDLQGGAGSRRQSRPASGGPGAACDEPQRRRGEFLPRQRQAAVRGERPAC